MVSLWLPGQVDLAPTRPCQSLTHHPLGQSRVRLPPLASSFPFAPVTPQFVRQPIVKIFCSNLPPASHQLLLSGFQSGLLHSPLEFTPTRGSVSPQTVFPQQAIHAEPLRSQFRLPIGRITAP